MLNIWLLYFFFCVCVCLGGGVILIYKHIIKCSVSCHHSSSEVGYNLEVKVHHCEHIEPWQTKLDIKGTRGIVAFTPGLGDLEVGGWCNNDQANPDSNVHGANMGPSWGRQDPGGSHVGPLNFAIWEVISDSWGHRKEYGFENKLREIAFVSNLLNSELMKKSVIKHFIGDFIMALYAAC